jgi:hypothetical protein
MPTAEPMELVSFLTAYPPPVGELFLAARALLLRDLTPVVELHYDATSAVCAGFSYTGDVKGLFVNLAAYADHVTLVFPWGANLKDPERRLRGGGKQVRHMRVTGVETLRAPYVKDLIAQARGLAPRPDDKVEHRIVVKVYGGPKRRPAPPAKPRKASATATRPRAKKRPTSR